jgi:hypothetical protein
MGTVSDKLNYLAETKEEIKSSIETMGVTVSSDTTFREYADKITDISKDADATAANILQGKTAYAGGQKITGTTPQLVLATPTLELASDTGIITATVTQTQDGFVPAGMASNTYPLGTNTASDLTVDGATVTAAAGYYPNSVSKSVTTTTQPTPSISVSSSGLITASYTPAVGYNSSTTALSTTKQLSTKAATTYTPTTSNQTIAKGYYLTGIQTIKGDSNLVAANIVSGVSIFGVSGTYSGYQFYQGTSLDDLVKATTTAIVIDFPSGYTGSELVAFACQLYSRSQGRDLFVYWDPYRDDVYAACADTDDLYGLSCDGELVSDGTYASISFESRIGLALSYWSWLRYTIVYS